MRLRPTAPLALLLATAAAPAALAQTPTLTFSDGVQGSQVVYELDGTPGQLAALLISLNQGPTPVALIDPGNPGLLEVGLDLLDLLSVVPLPSNVTFPLPASPSLTGLVLNAQFLTLVGLSTSVDQLSNPSRFTLGPSGLIVNTLLPNFEPRQGHTGTTSLDGRTAYIFGGSEFDEFGNGTVLASGERYDPAEQRFRLMPNAMLAPRTVHTATLLDDGRILILGGTAANDAVLATGEIFDPATETSTAIAPMSTPRTQHTATKLADGRVFVAGGSSIFDLNDPLGSLAAAVGSSEIYDPVTNSWSPGPNLPNPTIGHTASLLPSGRVLIAAGVRVASVFGAPLPSVSDTCRLYDPNTNSYSNVPSVPGARVYHGARTLADGDALIYGGADGSFITLTFNALASSYRYDEGTNSWSAEGNLGVPRAYVESTFLPATGQVVMAGGLTSVDVTSGTGTPTTLIEAFDPGTGTWSPLGNSIDARNILRAVTVDQGVRLLIVGANENATPLLGRRAELLNF